VAVVYPRQIDFLQQAAREGVPPNSGLLGYYSPVSNRIVMYDAAASGNGWDWTTNADTIIHEAAHQTAFNCGVHARFGNPPQWVVEGLGTMFEARGVWQSQRYKNVGDRINRGRLEAWRSYKSRRDSDAIAQLVSSDRPFRKQPLAAYAEAWALSFFLCETMPKKYVEYLSKTASRPAFDDYTSHERLNDFTSVFGNDLAMLTARMERFIGGLK
jgi:hypothetical protein